MVFNYEGNNLHMYIIHLASPKACRMIRPNFASPQNPCTFDMSKKCCS